MSKYNWVRHNGEKLFDVGILPDGTLHNPRGYPDEDVRSAVLAADARRRERRKESGGDTPAANRKTDLCRRQAANAGRQADRTSRHLCHLRSRSRRSAVHRARNRVRMLAGGT